MSYNIPQAGDLRGETSALLKLAMPLLIAQLAQMGTGVVDTVMAGRYSSLDLAAIAIGYNIWLPIYLISLGTTAMAAHQIAFNVYDVLYVPLISVGSAMTTRMGHAIGAGKMPAVKQSLCCGLLLLLAICTLVTPILIFFPDPVARIYTEDPDIRALSVTLLRVASLFVFIDLLAVPSSAALRAFKDTRFPFLVMGVAYWLVALPVGYGLGLTD
ncbi:MAG: MATE family efflux transporter, partial [Gammaproteobacteria bacterium]|nr:MATE family efflux transporter [Gammaproteobacteria bacterium]